MTRDTTMDKSRLAAFADGELTPEEAAAMVIHLADHPEDQAFIDDLMAANTALARAFAAPMAEPVPDRLGRLVLPGDASAGATVIAFPALRRLGWAVVGAGLGVAATLAALALLPGGNIAPAPGLAAGPVAAGSALETALATARTGEAAPAGPGAEIVLVGSFPGEGGICREFEVRHAERPLLQLGLACLEGTDWVVDVLIAETLAPAAAEGDTYLPAAGAGAGLLDPWLDRRGAGLALGPAEEAELIGRNWRP
jgi:hypothetical protein